MAQAKPLTEDDFYRASTQYRFWSFTRDSLSELRTTTNSLATVRVRDATRRAQGADAATAVDCLTLEEEQKIVGFYCQQAMKLADFCDFPTNIKATAVQYLKRFYLSNSPMTYHPKHIMPCAIFFATKTDNHFMSLKTFASKLPKTTPAQVIAYEYLLLQGLRFTFDVRHPHRGMAGGFMELHEMSMGTYDGPGSSVEESKHVQEKMMSLRPPPNQKQSESSVASLQKRIKVAYDNATSLLKWGAILGDAYFLYTPSQIWLGALMTADEPLASFYVETILAESLDVEDQVIETLHSCAALLTENTSNKSEADEKANLKRIDKKLYKCQNPEKTDIANLGTASKHAGSYEDEKVIKKRKLDAEKAMNDPFGPSIAR